MEWQEESWRFDPPSDNWDNLTVWKITITWDGELFGQWFIPYTGYNTHLKKDEIEREFYDFIVHELGYIEKKMSIFVHSIMHHVDAIEDAKEAGKENTTKLLEGLPGFRVEMGMFRTMYVKSNIVNWLKDHKEDWLGIEEIDFCDVPEREQERIKKELEDERVSSIVESRD